MVLRMRNRSIQSNVLLGSLAVFAILLGQPLRTSMAAQDAPAKAQQFDPHDLSGVWKAPVRVTSGREVAPMTPWGLERFNSNKPFNGVDKVRMVPLAESNDPMIVCDPLGFPRNLFYQIWHIKFLQMPKETVQLFEFGAVWREIWTDGRPLLTNVGQHGGPDPRWYGYSVGKWDGDTFVINTTGVDDRSWLDVYGDPHSVEMRVEERYTRLDHEHMRLFITIDDPKAYTKPFVALPKLIFTLADVELPEQMCVPSEALEYLKSVAAPADGKSSDKNGER